VKVSILRQTGATLAHPWLRPLTEGWAILVPFAAVAIGLGRTRRRRALLPLIATALVAAGMRDPDRVSTAEPDVALSPADGRVVHISRVWDEFWQLELLEIVIYLSLLNVHVQRLPLAATIVGKTWRRGAYHSAKSSRAIAENHQLSTYLQTPHGPCVVKQRAGLVARRIVNWLPIDAEAGQGQRLGMIKFGSQTVVRLTTAFEPLVQVGSVVRAGVTPVAHRIR